MGATLHCLAVQAMGLGQHTGQQALNARQPFLQDSRRCWNECKSLICLLDSLQHMFFGLALIPGERVSVCVEASRGVSRVTPYRWVVVRSMRCCPTNRAKMCTVFSKCQLAKSKGSQRDRLTPGSIVA